MSAPPTDREMFRIMGKECMAFRVRRTSRIVTRLYDQALAEAGLSSPQLTLLAAVANRPDLKMGELAEVLGFEPSSLSRAMATLVRRRWVRAVDVDDRRERLYEITDRGREVARKAWTLWSDAQAEVKRRLGPGELEALARSLDALRGLQSG